MPSEIEEKFQFLVDGKFLSESDTELAKNIEDFVKAEGFSPNDEFMTMPEVTIKCEGGDKWEWVTEGVPWYVQTSTRLTYFKRHSLGYFLPKMIRTSFLVYLRSIALNLPKQVGHKMNLWNNIS